MKRIFKFNREVDGRWYVDLPEWEGSKADLEMVAGADVMLEYLKYHNQVELLISEEDFKMVGADIILYQEYEGNYIASDLTEEYFKPILNVWLCEVTLFVFGYYPSHLYLKVL